MGLFSKILDTIHHKAEPKSVPQSPTPSSTPPSEAGTLAGADVGTKLGAAFAENSPAPASTTPSAAEPSPTPGTLDVTATLDHLAAQNSEKLDWRKSIVDLMKLVGMDSSLSERKELAAELHYPGDTSDSAEMNVWLHKEVIRKLAKNGGKVPSDLLT